MRVLLTTLGPQLSPIQQTASAESHLAIKSPGQRPGSCALLNDKALKARLSFVRFSLSRWERAGERAYRTDRSNPSSPTPSPSGRREKTELCRRRCRCTRSHNRKAYRENRAVTITLYVNHSLVRLH